VKTVHAMKLSPKRSNVKNRMRKIATAGFGAVAGALAITSLAWACTAPIGSTWYADGTQAKSGRPGTQVAVYATGAILNQAYTLVVGDAGPDGHGAHACMRTLQVLNPTIRFANSSGFLSTTVGTVTYSTPGTYEVCFKDNSAANTTGTPGASFTVL